MNPSRSLRCAELPRSLSAEEARLIIEPYFDYLKEQFVTAGLRRAGDVRLQISGSVHDTARHFAATRDDGRLVIMAPEAAGLPEDNLVGIAAHELGHAMDFAYPGRFQLRETELIEWQSPDWAGPEERKAIAALGLDWQKDKAIRQTAYARRKQWESRDDDEVERTADAIAGRTVQRPIFYRGQCLLQSFESGSRPRPEGLR